MRRASGAQYLECNIARMWHEARKKKGRRHRWHRPFLFVDPKIGGAKLT
jgi:hypothetical protein